MYCYKWSWLTVAEQSIDVTLLSVDSPWKWSPWLTWPLLGWQQLVWPRTRRPSTPSPCWAIARRPTLMWKQCAKSEDKCFLQSCYIHISLKKHKHFSISFHNQTITALVKLWMQKFVLPYWKNYKHKSFCIIL